MILWDNPFYLVILEISVNDEDTLSSRRTFNNISKFLGNNKSQITLFVFLQELYLWN